MNWVDFEGTTFNLDKVTHFEIKGSEQNAELEAYLNSTISKKEGRIVPVCILIARGTKEQCETWRKDIIFGKYNMKCKGHLYPIREHLNTLNIAVEKIESHLKLLIGEKQ